MAQVPGVPETERCGLGVQSLFSSPWHSIYDSSVTKKGGWKMIQIFSRERDTLSSEGEIGEGHLGFEVKLSAKPSSYLLPFSMIPLAASRVRIINLGNGANWGGRLVAQQTIFIIRARTLITHVGDLSCFCGRSWSTIKGPKRLKMRLLPLSSSIEICSMNFHVSSSYCKRNNQDLHEI